VATMIVTCAIVVVAVPIVASSVLPVIAAIASGGVFAPLAHKQRRSRRH